MTTAASEQRSPSRRWRWVVAALIALAILGLLALWLVVRGHQAQTALTSARAGVTDIRKALETGDIERAKALLPGVQDDTARAVDVTSDPVFSVASALPVVGNTPDAVHSVAVAADNLATQVLPPLLGAGEVLVPDSLSSSGDQINVDAFKKAAPLLNQAVDELSTISDDVAGINTHLTPSQVSNAVETLQTQLTSVLDTTQSAARGAELLFPMLGGDGPRHYLLAFQSNSEARGTGGLLGSYGIVTADNGHVHIDKLASRDELDSQTYDHVPLNFGKDYNALYGDDPASWGGANMSPHFPYAAQLWLKMWRDRTGDQLDGVLTADPVTLSYLLKATGPITLNDGRVFNADNVVDFTENGIYLLYPHSDHRRNVYQQQIASKAMDALLSGDASPQSLVDALGQAASERRLLVYSTHPKEQRELLETSVSGAIPSGPAPLAGIGVINGGGNKLDYYLRTKMDYEVMTCKADGTRLTRTTVTLTNTAPDHGLPMYVDARLDLGPGPNGRTQDANGANLLYVQVYTTQGSTLVLAKRDDKAMQVDQGEEVGHPVYRAAVELGSGETTTLRFDLREPPTSGAVRTFTTPLVKPTPVSADDTECGSA